MSGAGLTTPEKSLAGAPTPARPTGLGGAIREIAADIKLWHSVFALPFAVLGAFLAWTKDEAGWAKFGRQLAMIVACMVLARTWAMLVNRLADRRLDAANERTRTRAFAAGRVSPVAGWMVAATCALGVLVLAWLFLVLDGNPWPLYLGVPVLGYLAAYSWSKRFTMLCHLLLGLALALSPLAAAIAVRPAALGQVPTIWWTAAFVALWVAGFDVIYAMQDEEFDKAHGVHSVPAALGAVGAAWVARGLHLVAMVALLAAWTSDARLGGLFGLGAGVVGALLLVEHALLARSLRGGARPGLHAVFFTLNGVVSVVAGVAGCVDVVR
jgi:4-hydroxybenzoate polyprenyltransferase